MLSKLVRLSATLSMASLLVFSACSKQSSATIPSTTTGSITQTTSPSVAQTKPAGPYGELRFALGALGNERFNPAKADATHRGNVLAPMFDFMFWRENRESMPDLVEKWELADDGLSWVFHIRKGIKFHNGEELSAEDVRFSIEQYMRSDAERADVRNAADRLETIDEFTLQVYTKGKQPYLQEPFTVGNVGMGIVIPKGYIEQNGMDYFERYPIGTGPYEYSRRVPGDMVQYQARDQHWRQTAAFRKLTIILMPEESTRVASLKTGAVDVIEVGFESADELESAGFNSFISDVQTPMPQFHGAFDPRAAGMPITDIRVRQALSLAINRDEIRQSFFRGKAGAPLPPYLSEGQAEFDIPYWMDYCAKAYRYDPEEAKRLLKEAGYPQGFTIKFFTWAPPGASYLPKLGEVVQDYWARVGVKAEINPIDQGTYTSWRKGPSEPLVGQATLFRFPGLGLTLTNLSSGFEGGATNNLLSKGVPEFDALIKAARSEMDATKRKELIAQMIKIAVDSYTAIQLCSAPSMGAVNPAINLNLPSPRLTAYIATYAILATHAD